MSSQVTSGSSASASTTHAEKPWIVKATAESHAPLRSSAIKPQGGVDERRMSIYMYHSEVVCRGDKLSFMETETQLLGCQF